MWIFFVYSTTLPNPSSTFRPSTLSPRNTEASVLLTSRRRRLHMSYAFQTSDADLQNVADELVERTAHLDWLRNGASSRRPPQSTQSSVLLSSLHYRHEHMSDRLCALTESSSIVQSLYLTHCE
jgi:hypothetical protein